MSLFAAISLGPEGIAGVTQPLWDIKLKVWTELPGGVNSICMLFTWKFWEASRKW